ncbi:plasmid mobilization protein [Flavobacterium sp. GT3P67]|uniref:plasmid mobilization protein n=1 Tax=Flavobacterium sp. GT3P67 TaxID=2541722 RepID=UPI00197AB7FC|nr:plasmid mobilization relaxosome protein MobC [Flavobacterium sp. GT3P67]
MMEKENSNRSRIIGLRLTPEEYAKIYRKWKASTCRKLSDYVRKHLFNKPITTNYRNQSLDDFIEETVVLRNELSAIGNNVNQVVKKMHTLQQIPEFREWIVRYELEKRILSNKMEDIQNHIQKITDKWLQS